MTLTREKFERAIRNAVAHQRLEGLEADCVSRLFCWFRRDGSPNIMCRSSPSGILRSSAKDHSHVLADSRLNWCFEFQDAIHDRDGAALSVVL